MFTNLDNLESEIISMMKIEGEGRGGGERGTLLGPISQAFCSLYSIFF